MICFELLSDDELPCKWEDDLRTMGIEISRLPTRFDTTVIHVTQGSTYLLLELAARRSTTTVLASPTGHELQLIRLLVEQRLARYVTASYKRSEWHWNA